ncbi:MULTISPECIES: thermonuclease family protein [Phyllobacterium]|jgi:micrococcal nuclease|uniref:thermonuclease family protein n=1 Tax=Phyllobacterium TaxID=28100 RepID=UPI001CBB8FE6|nr:thermonuclease family protein [Phyllobacterium calauticae]MBZ3695495.1 thermonuclease family protein [Phyllobacterium calauticae]
MKKTGMTAVFACCMVTGIAVASAQVARTENISGDRIIVIDGDTVALPCKPETGFKHGCAVKVRLKDIDTPEVSHPTCENELAKGLEAKARLRELISGELVTIKHTGEIDRYGRSLGWLVLQDGSDIGAILFGEGLALEWTAGARSKAARISHWCGAASR